MSGGVLLVPECGPGHGLGHLERCLALADHLARSVSCDLAVADDAVVRERVTARGHRALARRGALEERALAAADDLRPGVTVIDGYGMGVDAQVALRGGGRLVVVDDLGGPCDCDLAVNPSPGAGRQGPAGAERFLGGAGYAIVAEGYLDARRRRGDAAAAEGVLVATGAADAGSLGTRLVATLLDADASVTLTVVRGPEAAPLPANRRLRVVESPATLADLLAGAAVYAGAAGTTAVQAACVGTPAVVTATVDNQQAQAVALAAAGCAVSTAPADMAGAVLRLLGDAAELRRMSQRGRELVDGRGAERVADALLDLVGARAVR